MSYTPVIGLEIHAELKSRTKVFCSCENSFGKEANTLTCPVCLGLPGALPSLNAEVVTLAAKAALSLGGNVNNHFTFDRKNYFYPDLPKAYQITQLEYPISTGGALKIGKKSYGINNIHIEEDAGKLIHTDTDTLLDFNRAGIPLIEIVTEPDFVSAKEVCDFVSEVALRLRYAEVCDAKMEEGSIRVDVNISLMPDGSSTLGTRAEIKNINSLRSITSAIEYEIKRQTELLLHKEEVVRETRRFDERTGKTYSMRSKEDGDDYRYFPEPDIPPVYLSDERIREISLTLPEMPGERFMRYTDKLGLSDEEARLIVLSKEFSDFFDNTTTLYKSYRETAKLMTGELLRYLSGKPADIISTKLTPESLSKIVKLSENGTISKGTAKELVSIIASTGADPVSYVHEHKMIMSADTGIAEEIIDKVLSQKHDLVLSYKNGNTKIFGFLMGEIMRQSGKGANPAVIRDILTEKLRTDQ